MHDLALISSHNALACCMLISIGMTIPHIPETAQMLLFRIWRTLQNQLWTTHVGSQKKKTEKFWEIDMTKFEP